MRAKMKLNGDTIFKQFLNSYNIREEDVEYWEPAMNNEILVHMKNGNHMYFEYKNRSICYKNEYEIDGYGDYTIDQREYKLAFARKLKRTMFSKDITQKELSDLTGISSVSLSHYMNARNLPDMRNVKRICRALDCSFEELTELE